MIFKSIPFPTFITSWFTPKINCPSQQQMLHIIGLNSYLSIHISGSILCICWTLKRDKRESSGLVCFPIFHQKDCRNKATSAFPVILYKEHLTFI